MLLGLRGNWKHSIGYWYTNHFKSIDAADLMKEVFIKTHENGIDVRGMTCDGLAANLDMVVKLGRGKPFKFY